MRSCRRSGMTLVELLAAAALAGLLMSALVGVLRSLAIQRRTLLQEHPVLLWRDALASQLRWDLVNARRMSQRPGELRLTGYGGCDFDTQSVTHRPCEIVYCVQRAAGHSWLVRREIHLDSTVLNNARAEVVCADVAELVVGRIEDNLAPSKPDADASTAPAPPALAAVPNPLQLVLYNDRQEVVLHEVVCLP